MARQPRRLTSEPPASDPPGDDQGRRVIQVTPDQIAQADRRPWRRTTLGQALAPFLLLSAVVVALGVAVMIIALRLIR